MQQKTVFASCFLLVLFSSVCSGLIITWPTTLTSWNLYTDVCLSWTSTGLDGTRITKVEVVSPLKTLTLLPSAPAIPLGQGSHSFKLSGVTTGKSFVRITTDTGVVKSTGMFSIYTANPSSDRICKGACSGTLQTCISTGAGCESDSATDLSNCGGCGNVCSSNNIVPACSGGSCSAGVCNAGFGDCNNNKLTDGCEINLNTNLANCGTCGYSCPAVPNGTPQCSGGVCGIGSCNNGFSNCDGATGNGCEVNVLTDPNHCGNCAVSCSNNHMATRTCTNGVCSGTCAVGFADCNGNKASDGCECQVPVGSFNPINGPPWGTNPPCYTCQEACALLFGGSPAIYKCSTLSTSINRQAYQTTWGIGGCQTVADTYKFNVNYNCGGFNCASSTYCQDNCNAVNYCYL